MTMQDIETTDGSSTQEFTTKPDQSLDVRTDAHTPEPDEKLDMERDTPEYAEHVAYLTEVAKRAAAQRQTNVSDAVSTITSRPDVVA